MEVDLLLTMKQLMDMRIEVTNYEHYYLEDYVIYKQAIISVSYVKHTCPPPSRLFKYNEGALLFLQSHVRYVHVIFIFNITFIIGIP